MTYDFTSASFGAEYSGHHTQLYGNPDDPMRYRKEMNVESATNYLIEKGASNYKINIGVAFYGYGFNIPKKESNHPFIRSYGTLNMDVEEQNTFDYSEIKQKYINVYTDRFDEVSKVPYIYDQKKGIFITYDNRKSIMEKTRFLREKGLMGIFCWELSSDTKDFELTDAMGD